MPLVNRRAGISTACTMLRLLASFLGKHRQSIIDTAGQVSPDNVAALTAAINAIIAAVDVFVVVCDAWENAVHP